MSDYRQEGSAPEGRTPPPNLGGLKNPNSIRKRRRLAAGVLAWTLATAGAGAVGGYHVGRRELPEPNMAPSDRQLEPSNNQPNSSKTEKPAKKPTSTPEIKSKKLGNIDTTYIKPGEKYLTARRPNGELIKVPTLRNPLTESPDRVASSALGLMAAFLTTGDEKLLDNFSDPKIISNEEIRQSLIRLRDEWVAPAYTSPRYADMNKTAQVIIHDNPNNPARFSIKDGPDGLGSKFLTLEDGELFMSFHNWFDYTQDSSEEDIGQNDWQWDGFREEPTGYYVFTSFILEMEISWDKQPDVIGAGWDFEPVESAE